MKNWLYGWNVMRVVRLIMGVFIIFQGIESKQWIFVLVGAFFSILPIINAGCCGTSSCATNFNATNKKV